MPRVVQLHVLTRAVRAGHIAANIVWALTQTPNAQRLGARANHRSEVRTLQVLALTPWAGTLEGLQVTRIHQLRKLWELAGGIKDAMAEVPTDVRGTHSGLDRPYRFAEFFAGFGGFTAAVEALGDKLVQTSVALDAFDGEWNILVEDHFDQAVRVCMEVDHAHFAPPCRTYTEAR